VSNKQKHWLRFSFFFSDSTCVSNASWKEGDSKALRVKFLIQQADVYATFETAHKKEGMMTPKRASAARDRRKSRHDVTEKDEDSELLNDEMEMIVRRILFVS